MTLLALQDWMFRREAETAPGRISLATVRAVVKMFELRKVVEFEPDTGHSQSDRQLAGVSQMVMSSFIEDLIPGTVVHAPLDIVQRPGCMHAHAIPALPMRMPLLASRPAA